MEARRTEAVSAQAMQAIEGYQLRLRLVGPADAAYIHGLRTDHRYNAHLSPVTGNVADQRAWIEHYKERETAGTEYYYIIERRDNGTPCGVVRLYDIEPDRFTWGSWILDENKPVKAALESAMLSFKLGFEGLGATLASIDVRKDNAHAIAFYRRFGMTETGEDAENYYFEYRGSSLGRDERQYRTVLQQRAIA